MTKIAFGKNGTRTKSRASGIVSILEVSESAKEWGQCCD
jgi:hypothetical protein